MSTNHGIRGLGDSLTNAPGTNSRRRTARHFDDDEDEKKAPPTKRARTDVDSEEGKTSGMTTRRQAKGSYEEDADGFAFSRKRTNKTQQTKGSKVDTQIQSKDERIQPSTKSGIDTVKDAPPNTARRRPRKTLPVTPEAQKTVDVRRSKRLLVEKTPNVPEVEVAEKTQVAQVIDADRSDYGQSTAIAQQNIDERRDGSPSAQANPFSATDQLSVQKARGPRRIHLMTQETPVIRRNKSLRQTMLLNEKENRRSSSGMRGKRVSGLIDSGNYNAVPHNEVETADFYRHIEQSALAEPQRMKQLLVWCAKRATGDKSRSTGSEKPENDGKMAAGERQALQAARVIQEELLADFANKAELSNWFDREDTHEKVVNVSLVKKQNPRNIQNKSKLVELEAELSRLQADKKQWDSLIRSSTSLPPSLSLHSSTEQSLDLASINPNLLSTSQAEILSTLLPSSTSSTTDSQPVHKTSDNLQHRIDSLSNKLEFKIDLLHDSLHKLERYVSTAGKVADKILRESATVLLDKKESSNESERQLMDQEVVEERDVLRALGRTLARKKTDVTKKEEEG